MKTLYNRYSRQVISSPSRTDEQYAGTNVDKVKLVKMIKSESERGFHILYDKYRGVLYSIRMKFEQRLDLADNLPEAIFLKI